MEKKVEEKLAHDLSVIIDLFDRFMPKSVNLESWKEMAMYEAYHRLKNLNELINPPHP